MNKLFYWLGFSLFLGLINPVLSKSDLPIEKISEDSKNGNSKIKNKEIQYKSFANLNYSEKKIFKNNGNEFNLPLNFKKFFNNLLVSFENYPKTKNSNVQELEILADYEELSGSIIFAKGNVIISNKKAVLNTDSFSYDREKSLLIIEGDIKFKSQNQFLFASKIQYDFKNKKGFILDAYGSVNFDYLSEFLNNDKKDIAINDNFDEYFKIKEVKLDSSSNLELGKIIQKHRENETFLKNLSDNSLKANINPIRRTRFISERIDIFDNVWESETLYLTNDPFNDAQLIVKNFDFKIIVEEEKTKIRSKWSNLIFENNVTLPIGQRRINVEEKTFRWGAGYDNQKFDGFHVFRDFDPIYFNNENETVLDIRSKFLIQRALNGETKSFFINTEISEAGTQILGISAAYKRSVFEAFTKSVRDTYNLSVKTLLFIGKMITGNMGAENLSGPVGIAKMSGEAFNAGFLPFLYLMAILSISLGVLNLLPIPVLDGGQLTMLAIEAIRGEPLPARVENFAYTLGALMVGFLLVFAVTYDIFRWVG